MGVTLHFPAELMWPLYWAHLLIWMYILSIFGTPLFVVAWAYWDRRRWLQLVAQREETQEEISNIEGDIEPWDPNPFTDQPLGGSSARVDS